jgi:hypothetical protein
MKIVVWRVLKILVIKTTRLKRLPVISSEHFRKTHTNYFFKTLIWYLKICKMLPQILALKKGIGMSTPIGTSNTNWQLVYKLVFETKWLLV